MAFEIVVLALAFIVAGYNFHRMRKVQRKIFIDWADPNTYCSDEYADAFTQAFEKQRQNPRSVPNG